MSYSFLKGQTAASLYGSNGRDGVIIINTKKGTKDKRGYSVEFNSSTMFEAGFLAMPKLQHEYGPGSNGKYAFRNGLGGGVNDNDYDIWGPKFNGQPLPQYDGTVDPTRTYITTFPDGSLPAFLEREYGVEFKFNQLVTEAYSGFVMVGSKRVDTDMVCICSGADLELLFPHVYTQHFTKCKLQMLRLVAQQSNHRFGPAICGGLSLIHYKSFGVAQSLPILKEVYELEYPAYIAHGIHVMACQNHLGELTVGDSHEYGKDFDPFDKAAINELILDYLEKIAIIDDWRVIQTWNGVYPKMTNGATELVQEVDKGVWVINGLGGAGMTLSFGLTEEFAKQFT